MSNESKYRVMLMDVDGYVIGERSADTIREAKQTAKYMLSDAHATVAETTHERMGTHKVEVQTRGGVCEYDEFYSC